MKPEALTVLDGYVGFDTLTEQIRKKALQQGFEFNVMVVGESCLLTFANSHMHWLHLTKSAMNSRQYLVELNVSCSK